MSLVDVNGSLSREKEYWRGTWHFVFPTTFQTAAATCGADVLQDRRLVRQKYLVKDQLPLPQ